MARRCRATYVTNRASEVIRSVVCRFGDVRTMPTIRCSCRDQASNSFLARSASIGINLSRQVSRLIIPLDMPP
jgi:hypothetical protein